MSLMEKVTLQKDYVTKIEFRSSISAIKSTLSGHSVELRDIKEELKAIKEIIRTLRHSMMNIEAKINIYSDMYEMNKWNLNKLANRVNKLEKQSGVTPPQELLISGL